MEVCCWQLRQQCSSYAHLVTAWHELHVYTSTRPAKPSLSSALWGPLWMMRQDQRVFMASILLSFRAELLETHHSLQAGLGAPA